MQEVSSTQLFWHNHKTKIVVSTLILLVTVILLILYSQTKEIFHFVNTQSGETKAIFSGIYAGLGLGFLFLAAWSDYTRPPLPTAPSPLEVFRAQIDEADEQARRVLEGEEEEEIPDWKRTPVTTIRFADDQRVRLCKEEIFEGVENRDLATRLHPYQEELAQIPFIKVEAVQQVTLDDMQGNSVIQGIDKGNNFFIAFRESVVAGEDRIILFSRTWCKRTHKALWQERGRVIDLEKLIDSPRREERVSFDDMLKGLNEEVEAADSPPESISDEELDPFF